MKKRRPKKKKGKGRDKSIRKKMEVIKEWEGETKVLGFTIKQRTNKKGVLLRNDLIRAKEEKSLESMSFVGLGRDDEVR